MNTMRLQECIAHVSSILLLHLTLTTIVLFTKGHATQHATGYNHVVIWLY